MPKAVLTISCGMLKELLWLPEDAEILYSIEPRQGRTVRLVIEAPSFPEVAQGADLPALTPMFRKEIVPSTVTMVDWGIG